MDQSKTAAKAAAVARQLDFSFPIEGLTNANGNSALPNHPRAQLQSKLLTLAQSRQLHARETSRSPPRITTQKKPPPQQRLAPRELSQAVVRTNSLPQYRTLVPAKSRSPVTPAPVTKPALQPLLKTESPKSREQCNLEFKEGTPKKQKQCNCKNSRCLKMYCECFAAQIYCDGCNCMNCYNKIEHEAVRKGSIETILERNPDAFKPKIANSPYGAMEVGVEPSDLTMGGRHNKGCNCKKSGCLKKYCECFQANILCSDKCKCMDCKNFEGSEERKSLFPEHPANSFTLIQQAANAAFNGAIGCSGLGTPLYKNNRIQPINCELTSNDQLTSRLPQYNQLNQETCLTSDTSYSPSSVHLSRPAATTGVGPLLSSYRSPLAGILQSQHLEALCASLVKVAAEAGETLSGEMTNINNGRDVNQAELSVSSSHEVIKYDQNQHDSGELHGKEEDGTLLCESTGSEDRNGRQLSPGTLALMCNEHDITFMTADDPSTVSECNPRTTMDSASTNGLSQLYVEQERLVLTTFCDFLKGFINRGCIEEMKVEQETSKLCRNDSTNTLQNSS